MVTNVVFIDIESFFFKRTDASTNICILRLFCGIHFPTFQTGTNNFFQNKLQGLKHVFHSFLLKHKEAGELFFLTSLNNHSDLQYPRLTLSKDFFRFLTDRINDQEILARIQSERHSSRYSVQKVKSTSFDIYPLFDFPIGCACDDLSLFLQYNKFIIMLFKGSA